MHFQQDNMEDITSKNHPFWPHPRVPQSDIFKVVVAEWFTQIRFYKFVLWYLLPLSNKKNHERRREKIILIHFTCTKRFVWAQVSSSNKFSNSPYWRSTTCRTDLFVISSVYNCHGVNIHKKCLHQVYTSTWPSRPFSSHYQAPGYIITRYQDVQDKTSDLLTMCCFGIPWEGHSYLRVMFKWVQCLKIMGLLVTHHIKIEDPSNDKTSKIWSLWFI